MNRRVLAGLLPLPVLAAGLILARLHSLTPPALPPRATAATPRLGDMALLSNSGTAIIVSNNLGRRLNLSHSACGFTLTVQRGYADPHNIVVGYRLTGPAGRGYSGGLGAGDPRLTSPTLTDAQGHRFPLGEQADGPLLNNAHGQMVSFRVPSMRYIPSNLSLHLSFPVLQMNELGTVPKPTPPTGRGPIIQLWDAMAARFWQRAPCETYAAANMIARTVIVRGPFAFDVRIPVAPLHVATTRIVARSHGVTLRRKH